ncbi:MAG: peptidase S16 [Alphaproteobacteria bacterium]|nr:peptidase S16 [Alphaproteobacteria bacterium]
MTERRAASSQELPSSIGLFPLPGILLLPGANLPLHIFEPRYRDLVRDALGRGRLIGMIQPLDPEDRSPAPALYPVGCVGRMTSFRETEDGRFYISLTGVSRFRIVRELAADTLYRQADVSWAGFAKDLNDQEDVVIDREQLMPVLREFFRQHTVKVDWDALAQVPNHALVRSLAMTCPFAPRERQALLEAASWTERGTMILTLLQMAVRQTGGSEKTVLQ